MARALTARLPCLTWNSFLGPYDRMYETSVVKFLHLCFPAVIFIFFFLVTGGH